MKIDPEARPTARRIQKRGNVQKAHHVAGGKARGMVQVESITEIDCLNLCSIDPRVHEIIPQPVVFDLNIGRAFKSEKEFWECVKGTNYKPWKYTPDFWVKLRNGTSFFIDAKSEFTLSKHPEILNYPAIFESFGETLLIVTDDDVPTELKKNLQLLRPSIGQTLPEGFGRKLNALGPKHFTYKAAIKELGFRQSELFIAILTGHLLMDLKCTELKNDTELQVSVGCTKHLELIPL